MALKEKEFKIHQGSDQEATRVISANIGMKGDGKKPPRLMPGARHRNLPPAFV